tara:strand:- start:51 stop:299 length:249 start_codon:yes stop_codon:yes gene_type:complete
MAKEIDNYKAFAGVNFSNARSENESYEDYRERLRRNEKILKLYNTVGRDIFKQMFPTGIEYKVFEQPTEEEKVIQEEVGEAK